MVCYHPEEKWAIEFGKDDGIEHGTTGESGSLHKAADGTMLMVDPDGVTRFDPSQLQISHAKTYPALTHLLVNNPSPVVGSVTNRTDAFMIPQEIGVLEELVIDYQNNNFTIEFAAMEIISPKKNLYRHMLEGFDKGWVETDYKNRTATYTNLPSGPYTFRAQSRVLSPSCSFCGARKHSLTRHFVARGWLRNLAPPTTHVHLRFRMSPGSRQFLAMTGWAACTRSKTGRLSRLFAQLQQSNAEAIEKATAKAGGVRGVAE